MVTEYGSCPAFGYQCEYVALVEAQAAEIEKLREALKHQGGPNTGWDDYRSVVYEASAALGETK